MMKNKLIQKALMLFSLAASFLMASPVAAQEADPLEMADDSNRAYYDAFASQDGVIKRRSGLLIKIIERGDGPLAPPDGVVLVHYEGKLYDGTVFDSSYERGEPLGMPISRVIEGWSEAMMLMTEGSTWEIMLPPTLAYGEAGAGDTVPPNAVLWFKVELVSAQNQ